MPTLANIAIAGAGLTTAGGLVGGGYFVFKNEERPMEHFLNNVTKRELLKEGADADEWKQAWKNYINANSKTEMVDEEGNPAPDKPVVAKKVPKTTILDDDIWKVDGWKEKRNNPDQVPESFQKKCAEKHTTEKPVGIWSEKYKNFEKFCTKHAPSDD